MPPHKSDTGRVANKQSTRRPAALTSRDSSRGRGSTRGVHGRGIANQGGVVRGGISRGGGSRGVASRNAVRGGGVINAPTGPRADRPRITSSSIHQHALYTLAQRPSLVPTDFAGLYGGQQAGIDDLNVSRTGQRPGTGGSHPVHPDVSSIDPGLLRADQRTAVGRGHLQSGNGASNEDPTTRFSMPPVPPGPPLDFTPHHNPNLVGDGIYNVPNMLGFPPPLHPSTGVPPAPPAGVQYGGFVHGNHMSALGMDNGGYTEQQGYVTQGRTMDGYGMSCGGDTYQQGYPNVGNNLNDDGMDQGGHTQQQVHPNVGNGYNDYDVNGYLAPPPGPGRPDFNGAVNGNGYQTQLLDTDQSYRGPLGGYGGYRAANDYNHQSTLPTTFDGNTFGGYQATFPVYHPQSLAAGGGTASNGNMIAHQPQVSFYSQPVARGSQNAFNAGMGNSSISTPFPNMRLDHFVPPMDHLTPAWPQPTTVPTYAGDGSDQVERLVAVQQVPRDFVKYSSHPDEIRRFKPHPSQDVAIPSIEKDVNAGSGLGNAWRGHLA